VLRICLKESPSCPLAACSRDHFLVKDKDLPKALEALEGIGLKA